MILFAILGALTLLSLLLTVWQWNAARRFTLHQADALKEFAPPVTIIKPLKGREPRTRDCLKSWLEQRYRGDVQFLFGVDSEDDPVCGIVGELISGLPPDRAELVICDQPCGPHPKISKLIQLTRRARHDVLAISDADVRVTPDYLAHAVSFLRDPEVGLVNSFYRFANPANLAMRIAAINVNADFWSQVLQSNQIKPQDFALGAVMITRKMELEQIGGFEAFSDYFADDYQFGNRIAGLGKRIALTSLVVDCLAEPAGAKSVWKHQLRQARTIRFCQPIPYFFSILSNATLWPLLWLAVFPGALTGGALAICLAVRTATALANQRKLCASTRHVPYRWLAPVKDLVHFGLWTGAFLGNEVEWRGVRYTVSRGGRLKR